MPKNEEGGFRVWEGGWRERVVTVSALDRDARDPNSSERMMTRCSHKRGKGIRLEFA